MQHRWKFVKNTQLDLTGKHYVFHIFITNLYIYFWLHAIDFVQSSETCFETTTRFTINPRFIWIWIIWQLNPNHVWKIYIFLASIFKGGCNSSSPRSAIMVPPMCIMGEKLKGRISQVSAYLLLLSRFSIIGNISEI